MSTPSMQSNSTANPYDEMVDYAAGRSLTCIHGSAVCSVCAMGGALVATLRSIPSQHLAGYTANELGGDDAAD